jgi:drug/metabolite transporter (DMT)-like permease
VNVLGFFLCVLCQVLLLTGQILFKHAMHPPAGTWQSSRRTVKLLALGIAIQTVYFFLWLGLMENHPLTRIYSFEGLNPAMMAVLAWLLLKEKLPVTAWVGLVLVCAGIGLVSMN